MDSGIYLEKGVVYSKVAEPILFFKSIYKNNILDISDELDLKIRIFNIGYIGEFNYSVVNYLKGKVEDVSEFYYLTKRYEIKNDLLLSKLKAKYRNLK